jgi:16S rRNA (cytosine967-C5)-methyltransferase
MRNSRRTAAFVIARWLQTKDFPSNLLPDGADRPFVQDLVYMVLRRFRPLRKVLGEFVKKWPKGELEALLYVGAAQILYMNEIPDFAAVNETVEAAKECENRNIAKVVNGVLRNLIRRREEMTAMISASSADERESFPSALYRRWVERFGADDAEKLAKWHNEPAETFLSYPDGRYEKLERGRKVTEVEGFTDGKFIVQDPGTRLAIELLCVNAGEKILDACAAPGGKTIQIAWRGAETVACEVNPKRRRRLVENLRRSKLADNVQVIDNLDGEDVYDKVLVDAPCSNTGVFRRRPDARWNWNEEKLNALVTLQAQILDKVAAAVKPGGRLVYSTCSNEQEENQQQVEAFLKRHPEFVLVQMNESVPFISGHDGAFAAALDRKLQ